MAKGALYWRLKDEKTGKWSYKKVYLKTFNNLTEEECRNEVYSFLEEV